MNVERSLKIFWVDIKTPSGSQFCPLQFVVWSIDGATTHSPSAPFRSLNFVTILGGVSSGICYRTRNISLDVFRGALIMTVNIIKLLHISAIEWLPWSSGKIILCSIKASTFIRSTNRVGVSSISLTDLPPWHSFKILSPHFHRLSSGQRFYYLEQNFCPAIYDFSVFIVSLIKTEDLTAKLWNEGKVVFLNGSSVKTTCRINRLWACQSARNCNIDTAWSPVMWLFTLRNFAFQSSRSSVIVECSVMVLVRISASEWLIL